MYAHGDTAFPLKLVARRLFIREDSFREAANGAVAIKPYELIAGIIANMYLTGCKAAVDVGKFVLVCAVACAHVLFVQST
jgi:hypothetical protein